MTWCHQASSHYLSQSWPICCHLMSLGNNVLKISNTFFNISPFSHCLIISHKIIQQFSLVTQDTCMPLDCGSLSIQVITCGLFSAKPLPESMLTCWQFDSQEKFKSESKYHVSHLVQASMHHHRPVETGCQYRATRNSSGALNKYLDSQVSKQLAFLQQLVIVFTVGTDSFHKAFFIVKEFMLRYWLGWFQWFVFIDLGYLLVFGSPPWHQVYPEEMF